MREGAWDGSVGDAGACGIRECARGCGRVREGRGRVRKVAGGCERDGEGCGSVASWMQYCAREYKRVNECEGVCECAGGVGESEVMQGGYEGAARGLKVRVGVVTEPHSDGLGTRFLRRQKKRGE